MPTVTIGDNTGDDFAGTVDASMDSQAPTENNGSDTVMLVYGDSNGEREAMLVAFTGLSNLPSPLSVSAASIELYNEAFTGVNWPHDMVTRLVLEDWIEGEVTWNEYASGSAWASAGCNGSADRRDAETDTQSVEAGDPAEYHTWADSAQLAADVEDFVDGTLPNYGWRIGPEANILFETAEQATREGSDGVRPFLSVTYTEESGGTSVGPAAMASYRRRRAH